MICGVYSIKNLVSGKVYIGSSVNIEKRWKDHRRCLNKENHHNRYLQRAWKKYGAEQFVFSILEVVKDSSKLIEKEQCYMDITKCYEKDFGYNNSTKAGNCLGVKHSDETRKKMSESSKGFTHSEETKIKISKAHKGKSSNPLSEEHKRKIGLKSKGRKLTAESREKIGKKQKGELNHIAKMSNKDVLDIKILLRDTELTQLEIANLYNVSFQAISNIKRNKSWNHVSIPSTLVINLSLIQLENNIIKKRSTKNLSKDEVKSIRDFLNKGMKQVEIAQIFNIDASTVSNINTGRFHKVDNIGGEICDT